MLPELWQLIFSFTDKSTQVAIRLSCSDFCDLLPVNTACYHRLFATQCLQDGNFNLFLLAREWGQPLLSTYYELAVKSNCNECLDYLQQWNVALPDGFFMPCVLHDNEEAFVWGLMYKKDIKLPNYVFDIPCSWLSKYYKGEPDTNLGKRVINAANFSNSDLIKSLLPRLSSEEKKYVKVQLIHLTYRCLLRPKFMEWLLQEMPLYCPSRWVFIFDHLDAFKVQTIVLNDLLQCCIRYRSMRILSFLFPDIPFESTSSSLQLLRLLNVKVIFSVDLILEWLRKGDNEMVCYIMENGLVDGNTNTLWFFTHRSVKDVTGEFLNQIAPYWADTWDAAVFFLQEGHIEAFKWFYKRMSSTDANLYSLAISVGIPALQYMKEQNYERKPTLRDLVNARNIATCEYILENYNFKQGESLNLYDNYGLRSIKLLYQKDLITKDRALEMYGNIVGFDEWLEL